MYRVCRFMVIVGHLKVTVYILDYLLDTLGLAITVGNFLDRSDATIMILGQCVNSWDT